MADFTGKRVVVMGLGRFGGGVGVTRFLARRGADVLVTDLAQQSQLQQSLRAIGDLVDAGIVRLRLGEHNVSDFTTCDLVVANPAVSPGNRFLRAAEAASIPITSEIRLLVEHLPSRRRTLGVTGTAGKSTVTAMIGHALRKMADEKTSATEGPAESAPASSGIPRVWIGGNLGGSLLPELDRIGPDDWIVLELSSFMLDGLRQACDGRGWSPHVAVVTNVMPNHLDWHGSFEHYVAAKQVILAYQRPGDHAVLGVPIPRPGISPRTTRIVDVQGLDTWTSRPALSLLTPGEHNRLNATLAIEAVLCALGTAHRDAVAQTLADFAGLPHRLQLVCEHRGVRFFNDSKSTTPEAAQLAIEAFEPGIVHVILGGYDKGSDLSALAKLARQRCRAVYCIGATGPAVAAAAEATPGHAEIVHCSDLDEAVAATVSRVRDGDVVLLSPGCASWDQFENYEQRGSAFVQAVLRCYGEGTPQVGA